MLSITLQQETAKGKGNIPVSLALFSVDNIKPWWFITILNAHLFL